MDDINLDNEIFLLGDFNINLLHNGKYTLKENQTMQNRIPSASLVSQYKLFCQRYSLEQIIKHATHITCSSSILIDHILTNFRVKISQSGAIDIGISDHQLIYLTQQSSHSVKWQESSQSHSSHRNSRVEERESLTRF